MLTLYLLRHAKSSWKDPALSDFDRPLNKRGLRDADALGQHMQKTGIHPKLVLLSTAKRACETYQHLAAQLPAQPDVITLDKLYGASVTEIFAEIHKHAGSAAQLMVIAHNPGIEALAWHLTESDPSNSLAIIHHKYPTSALATLTFDLPTWLELTLKSGTLIDFTSPRIRRSVKT